MAAPHVATSNKHSVAEEQARRVMEDRLGRRLSDQEWQSYRSRLVSFFQLLASWEVRPSSPRPRAVLR
jgi:hypothetical protein